MSVGVAEDEVESAAAGEVAEFAPYVVVPPDAMTIDYLVGDPDDVGHGLGSALVRALADDTLATHPASGQLLVPVAAGNVASQRVLVKAGFVFVTVARVTPDNPVDPPEQRVHRRLRS